MLRPCPTSPWLSLVLASTLLLSDPPTTSGQRRPTSAAPPADSPNAPPLTAAEKRAERQRAARERRERLRLKRENERAPGDWQQRLDEAETAGDAPAAARALYHLGLAHERLGQLDEAKDAYRTLVEDHPVAENHWSREATIHLFDLVLDHDLDIAAAARRIGPAVAWVATVNPPKPDKSHRDRMQPMIEMTPRSRASLVEPLAPAPDTYVDYELHLRIAVLARLSGNSSLLNEHLFRANAQLQSLGNEWTAMRMLVYSSWRTPVGFPFGGDWRWKPLLPESVAEGDRSVRTLLEVAGVYRALGWRDRALPLYERALAMHGPDDEPTASPIQRSWAHLACAGVRIPRPAPFTRPEDRPDATDPRFALVEADLEAAIESAPREPWTAEALHALSGFRFRAGEEAEGLALMTRVVEEFPTHPNSERVAYLIATKHERAERFEEAKRAFLDAKQRFPDSPNHAKYDERIRKLDRKLRQR